MNKSTKESIGLGIIFPAILFVLSAIISLWPEKIKIIITTLSISRRFTSDIFITYLSVVLILTAFILFIIQLIKSKQAIIRADTRRLQVMLSAIHVLDNVRFVRIRNKYQLRQEQDDDLLNPLIEESEVRKVITNDLKDITSDEINVVMDGLYRGKNKYRGIEI